ncbi:MAG: DUF4367 domain-containing protein [Eubacterium sp.]|nr:DUF4367 domain-containing protein [Eubacterium sp.]
MNESDFKDILAEICEEEIAELNKLSPFKPSLHHRLAMKRIFALYEKKTHVTAINSPMFLTSQSKHLRLSKRLMIIFAVIICAALLTGFMLVYFSKNFYGTVYNDNTQLFAVNTENCPITIEYEYYISDLPDGFEMVEHDTSSFDVYTLYENTSTGQCITFSQYVKQKFSPHYNTEHHDLVSVEINGDEGLCIDFSDNKHNMVILVWDNGDYILEIDGDLSKNSAVNLAKSTEILES